MFKSLSKKVIILFTLSCTLSLGIGIALGYGIHTQNLSATASNLSNPNISITNPSNELGSSGNIQLMFAKLNLEQAQLCKNESENHMSKIKKLQDLQQQLNLLSSEMEKAGTTNENQGIIIPLSLVEACADQKFIIEGEKVENGIKTSSVQIEQVVNAIGDEMQQTMILLQDYMNKYNSYLQQANEAIEKSNELLRALEKR